MNEFDLLREVDKKIQHSEKTALESIQSIERSRSALVERSIIKEYSKISGREGLAPDEIAAIVSANSKSVEVSPSTIRKLKGLYSQQSDRGYELSQSLMEKRTPRTDYKKEKRSIVQDRIRDSSNRLRVHQRKFAESNRALIKEASSNGWGASKLRSGLRQNYKRYENTLKRIIQTESVSLVNNISTRQYQLNGVSYVQRVSQEDDAVCAFCAERVGKVYRVEKAPGVTHPNCRCYNLPWSLDAYLEGRTDEEGLEQSISETIKKSDGRRSLVLTPFEREQGILESDILDPIDIYRDGIGSIPIEDRYEYDRQLIRRLGDYREPDSMGQAPFYRRVWSLVQGAVFTGLTLGGYLVVRQRYRAGLDLSALEVSTQANSKDFDYFSVSNLSKFNGKKTILNETPEDLILRERDYQKAQNIESLDGAVFIAGGLAGQQGFSSLAARDLIAQQPGFENMLFIDTPNHDFEIQIGNEELQQRLSGLGALSGPVAGILTAKNMAQMMMTNAIFKGKNQTAIRMAAQALNFHKKHPDTPITLMGYSGGGIAAKEAALLLNKLGLRVNVISSGSPDFGIFTESDFYDKQHTGFRGAGDVVPLAGGPPMNSLVIDDVPSHAYQDYANSPTYQNLLREAIATGRPAQSQEREESEWNEWSRVSKQMPEFERDVELERSLSSSIDVNIEATKNMYRGLSDFMNGKKDGSSLFDKGFNKILDKGQSSKSLSERVVEAIYATSMEVYSGSVQLQGLGGIYKSGVKSIVTQVNSDFENNNTRPVKEYIKDLKSSIDLTTHQVNKIEKYINALIYGLKHITASPLESYPSEAAFSNSF